MMKSIIMIGGFIEAIELCEKCGYNIIGIVDTLDAKSYLGYPVLGTDRDFIKMKNKYIDIPLVIVPDSPMVRKNLYRYYYDQGFHFENIISPDASVSSSASIGNGCFIQSNCNISSKVILGNCVKVNCGANIMHESFIDDYVTVAPNAVILGRCKIEKEVYIGANATVLPEHTIEYQSVVGAAAVVTKNVPKKTIVVGNPARRLKEEKCI